jgi:hypothetical protein
MSTFNKREETFEHLYAHDEELRFKAKARRDRLLGLWAAEKLGMSAADAEAYARDMVAADVTESSEEALYQRIRRDFDAANVAQSEHQIRRTMSELLAKAVAEVKKSG